MLHCTQTPENFLRYLGHSCKVSGLGEALSFIRWIHNRLCNSMSTDLLGDVTITTMHSAMILRAFTPIEEWNLYFY